MSARNLARKRKRKRPPPEQPTSSRKERALVRENRRLTEESESLLARVKALEYKLEQEQENPIDIVDVSSGEDEDDEEEDHIAIVGKGDGVHLDHGQQRGLLPPLDDRLVHREHVHLLHGLLLALVGQLLESPAARQSCLLGLAQHTQWTLDGTAAPWRGGQSARRVSPH